MSNAPRLPFSKASEPKEKTFLGYLRDTFEDEETVAGVVDAFKKLSLPLPESTGDFVQGTQGALVFVNKYAVVIRIERNHVADEDEGLTASGMAFSRVNDNPWILKPLGSIPLKEATIEICPGVAADIIGGKEMPLARRLHRDGIYFWDRHIANIGIIPAKTVKFPQGVPVVLDRLAVSRYDWEAGKLLTRLRKASGITRRQNALEQEASAAEEKLYGPLRRAFSEGWKSAEMKAFWTQCEQASREGLLVAGWNEKEKDTRKQYEAQDAAWSYQTLVMRAEERKITPPVPVRRQWRHQ